MQKKLILPLILIGFLMCSGLFIFSSEKIQSNQITSENSDNILNKSGVCVVGPSDLNLSVGDTSNNTLTWTLKENFDYLGKYSFTNDSEGGNPTEWTVSEPGGSHVNVISEMDGHHKVVELYRNDSNIPSVENIFPSKVASSGYQIEFWIR
ncbi:MAG TPA: hypothetical protein VMV49_11965, partial [Candidatus Deferrimicrobium sp.]|nr:hypothetical protein [Candidatus Deferrimicrobium sp.]